MKDEDLVLLLQLIRHNGNIQNLSDHGYQYSQIVKFIYYIIDQNYTEYDGDVFSLTDVGLETLDTLNKKLNRTKSQALISPQKKYMIEKMNKFEVYIPESIRYIT